MPKVLYKCRAKHSCRPMQMVFEVDKGGQSGWPTNVAQRRLIGIFFMLLNTAIAFCNQIPPQWQRTFVGSEMPGLASTHSTAFCFMR